MPVVALAATPPAEADSEALRRCEQSMMSRPQAALALADALLSQPSPAAEVEVMALACRASAQLALGAGAEGADSTDRLLALLFRADLDGRVRLGGMSRAALLLTRLGREVEALDLLEEVDARAAVSSDVRAQIGAVVTIAQIRASAFDDPAGALPYFRQAYALDRALGQPPTPPAIALGYELGYTLLLLARHDEAEQLLAEADREAGAFPEMAGMRVRIASHRAEILRAAGQPLRALPALNEAFDRQRDGGDAAGQVVTLQRLARVHLDLLRLDEARALAERALAMAEAGRYLIEQREGLFLLADISTARGDPAGASGFAARARVLDRERSRDAAVQKLARLQADAARVAVPVAASDVPEGRLMHLLRHCGIGALVLATVTACVLLWRARRRQRELLVLSTLDPLTGLPNRRIADKTLQRLAEARGAGGALLLIDVDAFKSVNDCFGHDVGDRVLTVVACGLRDACADGDLVARWGGEEFLVGRADSSRADAFALAEHLRTQVERMRVEDGHGGVLPMTVSIGVASLPLFPGSVGRPSDSIRIADRALYVAKRAGRNAWAGIWGVSAAARIDADGLLGDIPHALRQGWIAIGGNRPMDWSQARPGPSARASHELPARASDPPAG